MDTENAFYESREQSLVKHFILQNYLVRMAFKVGPIFERVCFVDAFSGPWKNKDHEHYSDTSFIRAIEAFNTVKRGLPPDRRFEARMAFCEKDPKSFRLLSQAVGEKEGIQLVHGKFEENTDKISNFFSGGFIFTLIDPTTFGTQTEAISKFISQNKGEFLWNYIADHANRFTNYDKIEETYSKLLHDKKWREKFENLSSLNIKNEEKVLILLRDRLKELDCASYILEFPVMRPKEKRVQFRLLFGTRHPKGVSVFRDVEKKAEIFMFQIYDALKRGGQETLFSEDENAKSALKINGINGTTAVQAAPGHVENILEQWSGEARFIQLMPNILEQVRLTESGLKDVLVTMRNEQRVKFDLPGRARKPRDETLISLP